MLNTYICVSQTVYSELAVCTENKHLSGSCIFLCQMGGRRVHGSPMGGTTGVSLEQGLGLGDISRGRPGRRPGGECSSVSDYYFIINKINPSS